MAIFACNAMRRSGLSHPNVRALRDRGLTEVPSTRLLVATARLLQSGIEPREACYAGLVAPLTDDAALTAVMRDLTNAAFV